MTCVMTELHVIAICVVSMNMQQYGHLHSLCNAIIMQQ